MNHIPEFPRSSTCVLLFLFGCSSVLYAELNLSAPVFLQAGGDTIIVPGYSVPAMADFNGDGLADLFVGEGSGSFPEAKVRIYYNQSDATPLFNEFSYLQADGDTLVVPGSS
jgi:hypothetical protein